MFEKIASKMSDPQTVKAVKTVAAVVGIVAAVGLVGLVVYKVGMAVTEPELLTEVVETAANS